MSYTISADDRQLILDALNRQDDDPRHQRPTRCEAWCRGGRGSPRPGHGGCSGDEGPMLLSSTERP